jgi:hypothetical protein
MMVISGTGPDLKIAVRRLQQTSFHISQDILDQLMEGGSERIDATRSRTVLRRIAA